MIVCSDHSQSQVEAEIDLFAAFDGFDVLPATRTRAQRGPPRARSRCARRRARRGLRARPRRAAPSSSRRSERTPLELDGIDLVMRMTDHPDGEAAILGKRGDAARSCASRRGGDLRDARGERWSVEGDLDRARPRHPRRPRRLRDLPGRARPRLERAALPHERRPAASAAPGYEFLDWGGAHHVGGGSHGSLHANDSLGSLIWCGTGPAADTREQWTLRDVAPMVCDHFGVAS